MKSKLCLFVIGVLPLGLHARAEVEPATYVYKTVQGQDIKADVFRANGSKIQPAIIWLHGGSLISGGRQQLYGAKYYLNAGIAVVSVDYRLAPETKIPGIHDDLRDAYRWLRAKAPDLKIDPDRIAVVGCSAGGYLAQVSGYILEPRPKAIVSFYGYGDVDGAWTNEPHPPKPNEKPRSREAYEAALSPVPISCAPNDDPKRSTIKGYIKEQQAWTLSVTGFDPSTPPPTFDAWCPDRNVTPQYPPALFLHGDKDVGVPYTKSVTMDQLLKRKGVESHLIIVPGYGHGFDFKIPHESERDALFAQVIAFLKDHLHP